MTAFDNQKHLMLGLKARLQRIIEKHTGENWTEALTKINHVTTWIREIERRNQNDD